jgi:hypothetical protein
MLLRLTNRHVSHDDVTVQIAVTVGCAYISFFIAQYILGKYSMYCVECTYFFNLMPSDRFCTFLVMS